ncbi:sensor histidine kinase [Haloplanus sp.]|uniref:sensor histidine kinase n=1 Tax=Haloplanus sp. TaxID=1961696 RepID=UPI002632B9EB|nr:HAMP domain-containing sensor histidine kinase [Haloplanus sp.]
MNGPPARSVESTGSDASILLALRPGFDRDLLADWLDSVSGYTVMTRGPGEPIPEDYDLCILDDAALARSGSVLHDRQAAAAPVLLPYLFVVSESDTDHAAGRPAAQDDAAALVSDVVTLPVDQSVLHRRIENLLDTRRATAKLAARERQLTDRNDRLERFAGMVSHDLRNPLNVAQGHVDVARDTTGNERLDTVKAALDRMNTLIDDMLTLARQGRPIDKTEPVSLSAVAHRCWRVVDTGDASLNVNASLDVDADADRLQQLFENLYRNSVEHGSTGGRSDPDDDTGRDVTIRVGALANGDGFYVADDGPGIPDDDRERIFESGYSTARNGTGFGLAIVREIVDAHDWTITVSESRAGSARFEIRT